MQACCLLGQLAARIRGLIDSAHGLLRLTFDLDNTLVDLLCSRFLLRHGCCDLGILLSDSRDLLGNPLKPYFVKASR